MKFDIAIIGGGPAGLCFASALAKTELSVLVVECQTHDAIADPAFDGREIALTHRSKTIMEELGLWQMFPPEAISPLRDAKVLNGVALQGMTIERTHGKKAELGYLVSNHLIRKAAFDVAKTLPNVTLRTGVKVTELNTNATGGNLTLSNGSSIECSLIVAADSRYSMARRAMGIAAKMHDYGKQMMVCVMEHDEPHHHVAWEWFDYGQTLALLPMNGDRSSIVITLPESDIQRLRVMDPELFNAELAQRFGHRLGKMRLVSTRHAYPLVAVYANRFVAQRFALIGDAAVGMHPVTAHGFNLGLRSADALARSITTQVGRNADIANAAVLASYERSHKRASLPLFVATHALAKLYTDDSRPARRIRDFCLAVGQRLPPFKRLVAATLTGAR